MSQNKYLLLEIFYVTNLGHSNEKVANITHMHNMSFAEKSANAQTPGLL
jgi:hypothetical protein